MKFSVITILSSNYLVLNYDNLKKIIQNNHQWNFCMDIFVAFDIGLIIFNLKYFT